MSRKYKKKRKVSTFRKMKNSSNKYTQNNLVTFFVCSIALAAVIAFIPVNSFGMMNSIWFFFVSIPFFYWMIKWASAPFMRYGKYWKEK